MNKDPKPRVLTSLGHFLPGFKSGGILRSVLNTVNQFRTELDFTIITRDRDLGDDKRYLGITPYELQTVGDVRVYYIPPEGETLTQIRKIAAAIPHDLIHLNSFFDSLTIKFLLNRRMGLIQPRPLIVSPRGEFGWASLRQKYLKKLAFILLARMSGLYSRLIWHASSSIEAGEIVKVMKVDRNAIMIALDLPTFDAPPQNSAELVQDPERDGLRVVFLSRISPEKNLDFALNVLSQVRSKLTFDIIGPRENSAYWSSCQKLFRNLPDHVTVRSLGSIHPSDVVKTLGQYDLLFFPSGGRTMAT